MRYFPLWYWYLYISKGFDYFFRRDTTSRLQWWQRACASELGPCVCVCMSHSIHDKTWLWGLSVLPHRDENAALDLSLPLLKLLLGLLLKHLHPLSINCCQLQSAVVCLCAWQSTAQDKQWMNVSTLILTCRHTQSQRIVGCPPPKCGWVCM